MAIDGMTALQKPASRELAQILNVRANRNLDTSPELARLLISSCNHSQVKIIDTGFKIQIGYIAWMNITRETLYMAATRGKLPSYSYEWREGRLMLIYDVVFLPKWNRLARDLVLEYLAKQRFVSAFKNRRIHIMKRPDRLGRFINRTVLGESF